MGGVSLNTDDDIGIFFADFAGDMVGKVDIKSGIGAVII